MQPSYNFNILESRLTLSSGVVRGLYVSAGPEHQAVALKAWCCVRIVYKRIPWPDPHGVSIGEEKSTSIGLDRLP
jgi:hypothetical protein